MCKDKNAAALLKEYIGKAAETKTMKALEALDSEYAGQIERGDGGEFGELFRSVSELAHRFVRLREDKHKQHSGSAELSGSAKKEYLLVQRLLDENLLTYHFQPIIRADNGQIYSYEALMRADGIEGLNPYLILKYAELSGRLTEVEEYTFLNVLRLMTADSELLHGRPVFINSMASVGVSPDKAAEIERLLAIQSGKVVIEVIESSEYNDNDFSKIKKKIDALGIPLAIDDFGTGYSNITNLLRYTPGFVKIDRSLISGIDSNPNKKHFVREIVDFCHENKIKALAEGVETSDELRTVIMLGVDLIQGFYTARPSADAINEVPYAIRAEIRAYRHELEDGRRQKIYSAERYEKVSLERLSKEGYSCLHIGFRYTDGSVTVIGSGHHDTGIHIVCADGFRGTIILDNARLSNVVGKPCIDIGNESCVTLQFKGTSRLDNGGVRVDESSKLITEGDGSLDIRLGDADYYGIGNDLSSTHGRLEFGHDGTVSVTAKSHSGVCIGSGLGGEIAIGRGRYVLNASGASAVGIGSCDGDTNIEILGCDTEITSGGAYSVGIGSVGGRAKVHIIYSSVKMTIYSQLAAGVGTLTGAGADIHIESMSVSQEMSAGDLTMFGAVYGESNIRMERTSLNLTADGSKALVFGGQKGRTAVALTDIDMLLSLTNELNVCSLADNESVRTKGGRFRITLNGKKVNSI